MSSPSATSILPTFSLPPSFPSTSRLLKQGAEGRVFLSDFLSRPCVVKQRFVKSYRHPSLDLSLTRSRLTAECRSLVKVRKAGVDAPCVYYVGEEERLIVMERIDGVTVRDWMQAHDSRGGEEAEVAEMMRAIGRAVAAVHSAGVIHGDLTTSNILLRDGVRRDSDGVPLLVSLKAYTHS
jgi:TP53 regulating kinase-like protein